MLGRHGETQGPISNIYNSIQERQGRLVAVRKERDELEFDVLRFGNPPELFLSRDRQMFCHQRNVRVFNTEFGNRQVFTRA